MFRLLLALCLCFTTAAIAQDRPRAILVLDASGSMWGQIDGTAKITIAQEVIGGLLDTLPPEQELGLTAYGHRRKGDCTDIETLIQPGGDRGAIAGAVNAIKPKGKTPLSAAVIQAAEALRYTEDKATVILVSDGKETCEFDPCEVGRQLEEAGVDFTAHVIGFDVSDPADRAQLACLAEETGGTFRTASDAGELADALLVVAEPPAPEPFDVTFNAKEGPGGPVISKGLAWTVTDAAGATLLQGGSDMTPTLELLPGAYTAAVTRDKDGASATRDFSVEDTHRTVVLVLPELPPEPVRVRFFATDGKNGPRINDDLVWDVAGDEAIVDTELASNLDLQLVKGEYTVSVLRPIDEAYAELRFGVGTVNKTVVLELPEYRPDATIEAPDSAVAGSTVQVRWTGPDNKNDFISVAARDADEGAWIEYTYTREGPLLNLRMPPEEGSYELRYVLNDGRKALTRRAIEVTPVAATITPPDSLPAGATVSIDWTGPDYKNDFLAVVAPGDEGWINYTYTREGSPLGLQMPGEPGDYDIIYTMDQKRTVLERVSITVTGVDFSVSAPESAAVGSEVTVDWTGPDYKNDYIDLAKAGEDRYVTYTYTREGSPLTLKVPVEPGDYEVRYVLAQDRTVMARTAVKVTPVTASLSGPDTADIGGQIAVTWEGPDYKNDYIDIAKLGARDNQYQKYTYTRQGSPLMLQMPTEPGDYELRYVMSGNNRSILARQPITVAAIGATLDVAGTAAPGSNLVVTWEGPEYKNDYLSIARVGDEKGYETYTYAREGSPLILKVPEAPGAYEVRYVMGQDRKVLERSLLTVE
ncbi:MAG: VWA domain-containing protein [Rhodobacter sp.]|nr:VWA domain-containing protein [Rhodobacter sp.]